MTCVGRVEGPLLDILAAEVIRLWNASVMMLVAVLMTADMMPLMVGLTEDEGEVESSMGGSRKGSASRRRSKNFMGSVVLEETRTLPC